jgi:hypothetical protein
MNAREQNIKFCISFFEKLVFLLTSKTPKVKLGYHCVYVDGKDIAFETFKSDVEWLQSKLSHSKPISYTTSQGLVGKAKVFDLLNEV